MSPPQVPPPATASSSRSDSSPAWTSGALLRLYEHTPDARLLETAKVAIAYEDTLYSPENRNWIDIAKPGEPGYKWQWCRGAPGIGLARLGGLNVLDTEQVRQDIEFALQTTLEFGVQGVDHPCCGNMGRAEVLLASGRRLSRPELTEAPLTDEQWALVNPLLPPQRGEVGRPPHDHREVLGGISCG